jgi:hypothetical protein
MKKSELEKIIKEELAKMKVAKPMKEQEEVALDPEVQNLVNNIVNPGDPKKPNTVAKVVKVPQEK